MRVAISYQDVLERYPEYLARLEETRAKTRSKYKKVPLEQCQFAFQWAEWATPLPVTDNPEKLAEARIARVLASLYAMPNTRTAWGVHMPGCPQEVRDEIVRQAREHVQKYPPKPRTPKGAAAPLYSTRLFGRSSP